jgi:hypothetical protein
MVRRDHDPDRHVQLRSQRQTHPVKPAAQTTIVFRHGREHAFQAACDQLMGMH